MQFARRADRSRPRAARGAIGAMRRNATPQRARRTQGNGSFTARHAADRPTHSLVARIME
ncbi:hypothetical protein WS83_28015 [Burkholderia sp. MSMB2042]|nr:hypothetical protein WS77_04370 [Burkholderia sp. MSMB0265]KVG82345.1 hypothetical protein WS81_00935 [Burkholderia sp. MSMB2040]KVG92589.1 hypothetical protein WS82_10220 [Burkholderia sp. MSMB2041]KVG98448.1 hypothetical protein WS83_28015 [Burkholderia sp. MSMB2042]